MVLNGLAMIESTHLFCSLIGNLDLVSPKHLFRIDNNPWIEELADHINLGVSHVMSYLRSSAARQ